MQRPSQNVEQTYHTSLSSSYVYMLPKIMEHQIDVVQIAIFVADKQYLPPGSKPLVQLEFEFVVQELCKKFKELEDEPMSEAFKVIQSRCGAFSSDRSVCMCLPRSVFSIWAWSLVLSCTDLIHKMEILWSYEARIQNVALLDLYVNTWKEPDSNLGGRLMYCTWSLRQTYLSWSITGHRFDTCKWNGPTPCPSKYPIHLSRQLWRLKHCRQLQRKRWVWFRFWIDMFPCFDVRSDCSFKTGLINTSVLSMGLCMSVDKVGEVTLQKQTADTYSHSNFEKFVHFLSVFRHLHLRIQAGIVRTSTSMQVVSIPFFICLWCTSASIAISSTTEVCWDMFVRVLARWSVHCSLSFPPEAGCRTTGTCRCNDKTGKTTLPS